jgi:hypothetical protein
MTITALFTPEWITPSGTLGSVSEGDTISFVLEAAEVAVVELPAGEPNEIYVGSGNGPLVFRVEVGGTSAAFTRVGDYLTLSAIPYQTAAKIILGRIPAYEILEGSLPPGTGLVSGQIVGTVGNIPDDAPSTYDFTIRISNGSAVRDRRFFVTAEPVIGAPLWEEETLPPVYVDAVSGWTLYDLGTVQRGSAFGYTFGARSVDGGNSPSASVIEDPLVVRFGYNIGVPSDLEWDETARRLNGVVAVSATPGRYVFLLDLEGPSAPAPIRVSITVSEDIAINVAPPISIAWQTPPGLLGVLREADPCPYGVRAITSIDSPVSYTIVNGSLPPGLGLNAVTGDIIGVVGYVSLTGTYQFTIRARTENTYGDRTFSIGITSFYDDVSLVNVVVRATGNDRYDLGSGYRARLIPDEDVFRISDQSFGFPDHPSIYLVGGLRGDDFNDAISGDGTQGIPRLDYHGEMELILGGHRVFVVRDERGQIVYEVLVRELIDPREGSGGFSYATELPVEQKARYPHTMPTTFKYIYENSVRNIRLDLIGDLGFGCSDPSDRFVPGVLGGEGLPTWMRSPQVPGDVLTAPGFVLAYPVAFLRPGAGARALAAAEADTSIPRMGKLVTFGGYRTEFISRRATEFDNSMKILPFSVDAGGTSVRIGRYAGHVSEAVVVVDDAEPILWVIDDHFTVVGNDLLFSALPGPALIYVIVEDEPTALSPIAETVGGIQIAVGPYAASLISIQVDGVNVPNYSINLGTGIATFPTGIDEESEVVLVVGPSALDGTTTFEAQTTGVAKYSKLPGRLGKLA